MNPIKRLLAVLALALLAPLAMAPSPTTGRNYSRMPTIEHPTDCTAATAFSRHYCYEVDDATTWYCPVAADEGMCAADDWVAVGGGSAGSLDDADFGAFTCSGGVCSLDANVVEDADLNITRSFSVSWSAPITADDIYIKVSGGAITLTSLNCAATGSTTPSAFIVTVDECDGNATNCVSSGGTVTLSALVTNTADTTFTDAAVDDDDYVRIDVTSLTTSPDYAHCRVEYTF